MSPAVRLLVESRDRHRALLVLALVGIGGAVTMAVVGLPPIDLHGPLHRHGVMDPFCGGTRALRLAARGDLLGAWRWNPLSPLLLVAALAYLLRTTVGWACGTWVNIMIMWKRPVVWLPLLVAVVALDIRQQRLAPMLMREGY